MATGYAWAKTPLPVEKYCEYWINEIGSTNELSRVEWEQYWLRLEHAKIVEASAKEEFDKHFTNTLRQRAHPRPGLSCWYKWSLVEAQRLDAKGKFTEKVRERLNQILAALHAPLITVR